MAYVVPPRSRVIDSWSTTVRFAGDRADQFTSDLYGDLEDAGVRYFRLQVRLTRAGGLLSAVRREHMVVTLPEFPRLYQLVSVRPIGRHLNVYRITADKTSRTDDLLARLAGTLRRSRPLTPYEFLREQDVRAWVSVVHGTIVARLAPLLEELGEDATYLTRVRAVRFEPVDVRAE